MTLKIVEKEVDRFLASPVPEVLCMTGKWGVGKTYAWNRLVAEAAKANRLGPKSYAYVSLFGIDTLDRFRSAIFENLLDKKLVGQPASVETYGQNVTAAMAKGAQIFGSWAKYIPILKDYEKAITSAMSFLSVRNSVVVIDDIERKGAGLSIRDVFGMASFLKEQRDCHVAIILNRDALEEPDQAEFKKYFEKTVDTFVAFEPSPEESATIAFAGSGNTEELLKAFSIELGISNIRVLRKVFAQVTRLLPLIEGLHARVTRQLIHTMTLLGYAYYDSAGPTVDFLRDHWFKSILRDDAAELTPEEQSWSATLSEYDFGSLDDFDLLLLKGLEVGAFDEALLMSAAKDLDASFRSQDVEGSFSRAWDLFHDSFDLNADQVVETLQNEFPRAALHVSPANLDGTVRLMKELGRADVAAELIATYVGAHANDRKRFDLGDYAFSNEVKDPDVIQAFNDKLDTFADDREPGAVLIGIAKRSGWNPEDVHLLSKLSRDEFVQIFKNLKGTDLSRAIKAALRFGKMAEPVEREIGVRAREALQEISKEGLINELRVRRYLG